tara:strand:- start:309 stop:614 length:306 start_codon:yes stop_codon:yes gene_type:complete
MDKPKQKEIKKVALEFAKTINSWFDAKEIKEINKENSNSSHHNCATSDRSDSNMAMDEALDNCGYNTDGLPNDKFLCELFNESWGLAKYCNFNLEILREIS